LGDKERERGGIELRTRARGLQVGGGPWEHEGERQRFEGSAGEAGVSIWERLCVGACYNAVWCWHLNGQGAWWGNEQRLTGVYGWCYGCDALAFTCPRLYVHN
jgi:hypothetical protein